MNNSQHSQNTHTISHGDIVQFGLWLIPGTGTYEVVKRFNDALISNVFSFTHEKTLVGRNSDALLLCKHLIIKNTFLGKRFSIPKNTDIEQMKNEVKKAKFVICHFFWQWGAPWLMWYSRKHHIPFWLVCHGGLDPCVFKNNTLIKKVWFALWGKKILHGADLVICSSNREKDTVLAIAPKSKCIVINWPVEIIPLLKDQKERHIYRKKLGLAPDEKALIYLGRLHRTKRIVELIRVFGEAKLKKTKLIIVGPDEDRYKNKIERQILKSGCRQKVLIENAVFGNEKYKMLQATDGYVSYSAHENFGIAGAEAMAAGLPVILSKGHDLIYEMQGINCGWFLENDNDDALAQALMKFDSTSPEELYSMGAKGREWTALNLSFEKFKNRISEVALKTINKL